MLPPHISYTHLLYRVLLISPRTLAYTQAVTEADAAVTADIFPNEKMLLKGKGDDEDKKEKKVKKEKSKEKGKEKEDKKKKV